MIYICVKLTLAGEDTGPFDIYTNADSFASPVVQNISKLQLLEGYVMQIDETKTTIIRVVSKGVCGNYFDVPYGYTEYTYLNVGYDEGECGGTCVTSSGTIAVNGNVIYSWPYLDNLPQSGTIVAQMYDEITISAQLDDDPSPECYGSTARFNIYIDNVLVFSSEVGDKTVNYTKVLDVSSAEFKLQTTCYVL